MSAAAYVLKETGWCVLTQVKKSDKGLMGWVFWGFFCFSFRTVSVNQNSAPENSERALSKWNSELCVHEHSACFRDLGASV